MAKELWAGLKTFSNYWFKRFPVYYPVYQPFRFVTSLNYVAIVFIPLFNCNKTILIYFILSDMYFSFFLIVPRPV